MNVVFKPSVLGGINIFCGTVNASVAGRAYLGTSADRLTYGLGAQTHNTDGPFTITAGVSYLIEAQYDGTEFILKVDGVIVAQRVAPVDVLTSAVVLGEYSENSIPLGYNTECDFSSFSYSENGTTYDYIQNGDFGDATLIDHSGNGNDGTINGATWVKVAGEYNYNTEYKVIASNDAGDTDSNIVDVTEA